ncbi:MAG: L,D-transpeptidase family protein [Fibrella sp.]|nr:L,D-transpeptidase family protein [Armatimonadota bacterium]
MKRRSWVAIAALFAVVLVAGYAYRRTIYRAVLRGEFSTPAEAALEAGATALPASRSVADVLRLCEPRTKAKFVPLCKTNGVSYPPNRVRLLAFKEEKSLEVWGANRTGAFHRLATYPIRAASGTTGPKRREGDRQVPEGFYRLTTLNPMSRFHVSIRVDYPNAADRAANPDVPVRELGGDIYVHGNAVSIGCLAMGDAAIEEIFCIVARAKTRDIWISPVDPRRANMPETEDANLDARYTRLQKAVRSMGTP